MKKVAILGKLSTKYNAPFKDLSYDIWTMNLHRDHNKLPRIDICFDLHKISQNPNANILRKDFPFEECKKLVGGNYFNNTVSYLIAYAILQGYEEIKLYGMRFFSDHERRHGEYTNVQCLISFAIGRGVKVSAPSDIIMLNGCKFKIPRLIENYNDDEMITIRDFNPVIRTIGVMNRGYRNILLCGYGKVHKPLIFYGKGRGCSIMYHNYQLQEFPDYDKIDGKDFDVY